MNLNVLLLRIIFVICVPAVVSQETNDDDPEEEGENTADLDIFVETFIAYLESSDVFSDEEKQNVRNIADVMKYVLAPPKGKASRRRMEMFNVAFLTAIAEVVVFDGDEHVDEEIVAQKTSVIAKALAFSYRNAFGSSNLAFINEIGTLIKIFVQAEDNVEDKFSASEERTTDPLEISPKPSDLPDNSPPETTSILDTSLKVSASSDDISIPENASSNNSSISSQSFVAEFQKYLYYDLLSSSIFRSAFSASVSHREINVLAIAMIESLITEPIFSDLNKKELLASFKSTLDENDGSLEDYAFVFATEISQILNRAGLLTEDNASDLSMDIALLMIEGLRNKLDNLAVQQLNNSTGFGFWESYFPQPQDWSGVNISDDSHILTTNSNYFFPNWLGSNLSGSSEQIYDHNVTRSLSDSQPVEISSDEQEDTSNMESYTVDYLSLTDPVISFTICLYEEFMGSTHFQTICYNEVRNGMLPSLVQSIANGLASTVLLNYTDTFEVLRFLNNSLQSLEPEFTLHDFAHAVAASFAKILNQYGVIGQNWSCQQATWLALLLIDSLSTWYQREMVYLNYTSPNYGQETFASPLHSDYQNSNSFYTSIPLPYREEIHTMRHFQHINNGHYSADMATSQPLHTFYVALFNFLVESEIFQSEFANGGTPISKKDSISAVVKSLSLSPEFSWIGEKKLFSAIIDAADSFYPHTTEKYADVLAILITQSVAKVSLVNVHNAYYRASLAAALVFTGLTVKQKSNDSLNLKLKQSLPGSNSVGTREKIINFIRELALLSAAPGKSENPIEKNHDESFDFHLNTSSPVPYQEPIMSKALPDVFKGNASETETEDSFPAFTLELENPDFLIVNASNFSNESKNSLQFVNRTGNASVSAVSSTVSNSLPGNSFSLSIPGASSAAQVFAELTSAANEKHEQETNNTSQAGSSKALDANKPETSIYANMNNSNELQGNDFRRGNHSINETSFTNSLSKILPVPFSNHSDTTSVTVLPKSVTKARDEIIPGNKNDTGIDFPQKYQSMAGTVMRNENTTNGIQNSITVNSSVIENSNNSFDETKLKYATSIIRETTNHSDETDRNVENVESVDTSIESSVEKTSAETLELQRENSRSLFEETLYRNVLSSDSFNYVVGSGIAKSSSFHVADAITKALFGAAKSKSTATFKLRLMKAFLLAPPSGDMTECAKELASTMGNFYAIQDPLDPTKTEEEADFLSNTILAVVRKWDNRPGNSDRKYDMFKTYYRQNEQDESTKVENTSKERSINETIAREKMLASIFETLLYHNLLLCQPFTETFISASTLPTGEDILHTVAESLRDIPGVNLRNATNRFDSELLNSLRRDTPKTAKEYAHIFSDLTAHILSNNSLISSANTFPLATIVANKICSKLSRIRNKKAKISNFEDRANRTFSKSGETHKIRKALELLNSEKERLSNLKTNNTEENKEVLAETLNTLAAVIQGQNLTLHSEEMLLKSLTESLVEAVHVILEHNAINAS